MTHGRQLPVEQSPLLYALQSGTGILKARTGVEPSYNVSGSTLRNVFPPARLHLPKVPLPSQTSTIVWGSNVHAHEPMGDILHLNHSADQLWTKLTSLNLLCCQVFCYSNGESKQCKAELVSPMAGTAAGNFPRRLAYRPLWGNPKSILEGTAGVWMPGVKHKICTLEKLLESLPHARFVTWMTTFSIWK